MIVRLSLYPRTPINGLIFLTDVRLPNPIALDSY